MKTTRREMLIGASAVAASCVGGRTPRIPEGTNVLVLCADEHHAGFMGSAGHPDARTPNLDRLALESVVADRCMVTAPTCAPTRASWMTGLYVPEHAQLSNEYRLRPQTPSLVQTFADAGYETACFGKLHTWTDERDGAFGFQQVLNTHSPWWQDLRRTYRDASLGRWSEPPDEEYARWKTMPFDGFNARVVHDPALVPDQVLTWEAIRFLQQRRDQPFFLFLSLQNPHYPFWLPEAVYGSFSPDAVSLPSLEPSASLAAIKQTELHGFDTMTEAQHRLVLARYLDATLYMDQLVGQVLDALGDAGLAETTLVIYQADHGDMAAQKGLWLKSVLFDAAARKPLMLRYPGVLDRGRVYTGLISEVDLLPTALGLVGVEAPPVSGRDLSAALIEGRPAREHLFAGLHWPSPRDEPWMAMATDGRHKLVRYALDPPEYELYNLEEDPEEEHDLAGSRRHAEVVERLDEARHTHRRSLTPGEAERR